MRLKKLLGTALGRSRWQSKISVIGEIEESGGGNAVLRVGEWMTDDSYIQHGHIVLTPDEREVLIKTLEDQRKVKVIEIGNTVAVQYEVVAVQYLNATGDGGELRGTILAYAAHKQQWAVLTAFANGTVEYGTYTNDQQRALNAYYCRIGEHLFPHFNVIAPNVTYAAVAERDKLKAGKA